MIRLYIGLLLVSFSWGTSFTAVKVGLKVLSITELVLLRIFLSAILFVVILFFLRNSMNIKIAKNDFKLVTWLAFCGIASYFPIQTYAINNTITLHTALIMALSPIFAAIMTIVAGKEQITFGRVLGIFIAFSGVVTIIVSAGSSENNLQSYPNMLIGDLILLLNALTWAHFTIMGKGLMEKYHPFVVIGYIFIVGAVMLVPYGIVFNHFQPLYLSKIFFNGWQLPGIILYLGGFCAVYSYFMWYKGVQTLGAVNTSVFMYINPLFATIAGIVVLGEELTIYNIVGGILVIIGVYIVNCKQAASR